MNAFEDRAFREAVKKTGRKRLIFGGLHTEICLTFATVQALKDGYEAMFVTDAVGGRSQTAHRTAIDRLSHAGAVPNTALAVLCELFRGWTSPLADKARGHRLVFRGNFEANRRHWRVRCSPICLNIRVAVIGLMMGHLATIGFTHEDRTWRADRCLSAGETL